MTIDDPLDRREDVTSPEYPLPVKVNTFSVLGLSFDNFVMNNKLARRTRQSSVNRFIRQISWPWFIFRTDKLLPRVGANFSVN